MIFNGASAQLAALMAVAGAGAIVASIIFSLLKSHRHFPAIVLIGAIGVGISLLLFAYVNNIAQGLTVTALLGFFATLVSLGSQSEMQIKVENELRGLDGTRRVAAPSRQKAGCAGILTGNDIS
jgi:hypothetical protein